MVQLTCLATVTRLSFLPRLLIYITDDNKSVELRICDIEFQKLVNNLVIT